MGKNTGKASASTGTTAKGKKARTASEAAAPEKKMPNSWIKSTCSEADLQELRVAGLILADESLAKIPAGETIPSPPPGWIVVFLAFFFRGLSFPAHEFLRGLLCVYGIQLHHLMPNAVLHIACFIVMCECFLGIHPHWGLWKRLYSAKKQGDYATGSFGFAVRSDMDYFKFKRLDIAQNWRSKWFYMKDSKVGN